VDLRHQPAPALLPLGEIPTSISCRIAQKHARPATSPSTTCRIVQKPARPATSPSTTCRIVQKPARPATSPSTSCRIVQKPARPATSPSTVKALGRTRRSSTSPQYHIVVCIFIIKAITRVYRYEDSITRIVYCLFDHYLPVCSAS